MAVRGAAAGRGKRIQFNILVSAQTKKAIAGLARDTGRSQSQICEALLAKGLEFDRTLVEIINKLNAIERALFEPEGLKTMFKPIQKGIGGAVGAVQPAPLSDEEATRRDHEERIARLEAMMRSKQNEG
jgi:hypothetical protein